jgi:F-box protein, helicase, 18
LYNITPTNEQNDAISHAATMRPGDTLLITAFAGTAKTTTLEMIAESLRQFSFLYLAFNKAIVEEAKKRFPKNVTIKTTHSLAFQYTAVGKRLRNNNYRAAEVAEIYSIDYNSAEHALSVFDFFCNSALSDFSQISADDKILEVASDLYSGMKSGDLDITHSWYLKEFQLALVGGLKLRQSFDYCLLDEAQDTNQVTLSIFNHLGGRKIKVGDRHQAIYAFRGAINAMGGNSSKGLPSGTTRKNLSTTFRCRPHIVEHANWILETFKGEQLKIVSGNDQQGDIKTQAFITRTNSALIEYIDDLDSFNLTRTPELIFDCLLSLVNWKYGIHGTISKQYKFLTRFKTVDDLNKYIEETDDQELKQGMKLLDKYDNQIWAAEGFTNGAKIHQLYEKARENYNCNGQSTSTLTTGHSAKGLEFDRVTIGNDFPDMTMTISKLLQNKIIMEPEDFVKSQKQEAVAAREEANLYYVAVTRARFESLDYSPNLSLYKERRSLEDIFWLARQSAGR